MFSDPQKNIERFDLGEGAAVADFGSGSGFYTIAAARAVGGNGRVFSIDVQKELLQKIKTGAQREHLSNVEVLWGNVETIGGSHLKDSSVDAVIVSNVLFQAENKKNLVIEAKRVLKPRGKVLVVDWLDSFAGLGPRQQDVFPKAQAQDLFEKEGFSLEKEIEAGEHHYGMILRKP